VKGAVETWLLVLTVMVKSGALPVATAVVRLAHWS
jgi:hypothetical protein